jgi:hypothetical protein
MKTHGMQQTAIQTVFRAATLSKLTYCSPAWYGYARAVDRERIEGFLSRCKRFGYCGSSISSFEDMCAYADSKLFTNVLHNPTHVLYHLLPSKQESTYNLRPRRHDRIMQEGDRYSDNNFIPRMLKNNHCA